MASFILTWNPNRFPFEDLADVVQSVSAGLPEALTWSCGNNKSIAIGDRIFMLRQGVEPRGIFASAWVTQGSHGEPHWDEDRRARGEEALYVTCSPDIILNPENDGPLDVRQFEAGPLSEVNWRTQSSGIGLSEEQSQLLGESWLAHVGMPQVDLGAVPTELEGLEGELRVRLTLHRGRERALREVKIAEALAAAPDSRLRCAVPGCGFDFEEVYGAIGSGYTQVHHLVPLSAADGPRPTLLKDLVVVCANCHAMIHRGGECRPLQGLLVASKNLQG